MGKPKTKKLSTEEQAVVDKETFLKKFEQKLRDKNVRGQVEAITWGIQYVVTGVDPDAEEEEENQEEGE